VTVPPRLIVAVAAFAGLPQAGWACAVCLGDPASPLTRGLNAGILVLLGFVGLVFTGAFAFIISMRRRMRALEPRRDS